MSEDRAPSEQRLLALQRYIQALEENEIESLTAVLFEAEHDQILAELLRDLDTIYQEIDGTTGAVLATLQANLAWPSERPAPFLRSSLPPERNAQIEEREIPMDRLMQEQPTLSLPPTRQENHRPSPGKRQRKPWLSALAAFFVVCALIGATRLLLNAHQAQGQGPAAPSTVRTLNSIVAVNTFGNQVYGLRPDTGKLVWNFTAPKVQEGVSTGEGVIVQGQSVYVLINSQIYALRATNGTLLWHTSLFIQGTYQDSYSFLFDQEMLYVSGFYVGGNVGGNIPHGKLFALHAANGAIAWHYEGFDSPLLTAHHGIVYVVTDGNTSSRNIRALRGSDGKQLWMDHGEPISAVADDATVYLYLAHPMIARDNGFHKEEKTLVALNPQSGSVRWSISVNSSGADALQLDQKKLFLAEERNNSQQLCAYQTEDGHQIWCKTFPGATTIGGAFLYVAMNNAISVFSGQETAGGRGTLIQVYSENDAQVLIWQKTLNDWNINLSTGSVASSNELLFLDIKSYIWALDRSGHVVWSYLNLQGGPSSTLAEGFW